FMDGDTMACSNEYERVIDIDRAGALLLFETSGQDGSRQAEQISAICRNFHAIYLKNENNLEKAETLWKIRRNLSKAVKASASRKIAEDICVPPSKLPELVNFVAQLDKEYPMRINSYGHAGDGNLHVNFLAKEQSGFEDQFIDEGINRLFAKTLELGGTLSGEHGIGLTKKDFLHLEFDSPTLEFMRGIKKVFDPEGLLNPGKMFA
ncbi:MAG: hypothetical protein NTV06_09930, partial [candidate division Zixibacteria bacterium]|nr:hypothetical protein [candidate division Zixibacteria bacterium]